MRRAVFAALLVGLPVTALSQEAVPPAGDPDEAHAGAAAEDPIGRDEAPPVELTPEQEARARRIEEGLKCPVCRSQSIRQSRSFMADDMRRKVRQLVAEGKSDEEVRDYFVDRYGQYIVLAPPKSGFNLAAWLLPFFVVVAGGVGVAVVARRWTRDRSRERGEDEAPPPDDPYLERLERELEESE